MLVPESTLPRREFSRSEEMMSDERRMGLHGDGSPYRSFGGENPLIDEIARFAEEKKKLTMLDEGGLSDEDAWRGAIRRQMEEELDRRVREALETPPLERAQRQQQIERMAERDLDELEKLNAHVHRDLTKKEEDYVKSRKWKIIEAKRRMRRLMAERQLEFDPASSRQFQMDLLLNNALGGSTDDELMAGLGLAIKSQDYYAKLSAKAANNFGALSQSEKHEFFFTFTRNGFREAMRTGKLPDGTELKYIGNGKYVDVHGIVRDEHGPFWPADYGPLHATPAHKQVLDKKMEPLTFNLPEALTSCRYTFPPLNGAVQSHVPGNARTYVRYRDLLEKFILKYKTSPPDIKFWPYGPYWPVDQETAILQTPCHIRNVPQFPEPLWSHLNQEERVLRTVENQQTPYFGRWRGVQIVYDLERSSKNSPSPPVPENACPSLTFESRFECGNLRQARRTGQFDYELVLKTDLYTKRHTQWYYFRVQNAIPGVTYRFRIINLLKKDSLYNHGMRPIFYSEKNAQSKSVGWARAGHHISYYRNSHHLQCPLLARDITYYVLEWQMEFPHANDTCYLAHCYPYTYTDLKDDLDTLQADAERSKVMKREVMCETRAGNSCFLVTVSNFDENYMNKKKKAVVVTGRVHPGESNSSWMMKGLLEFITSNSAQAKELRERYVFKIVPMLNPDGVIVGNYRCSLAARDLNRNYRHPRKESFPTIWYTKEMMENFSHWSDLGDNMIMLYCDMHGHSRKQNVFMYGCNTSGPTGGTTSPSESFLNERLFPWLMAKKAPDKFSFKGCKFQIRRCKEATGRVVMFRQMRILNSFTMEATFCGTTICKGEKRHFNALDFQQMGRVFGEAVLEYHQTQENREKQSEAVVDLTRAVTHQILESRGLLASDIPDITTEEGQEKLAAMAPKSSIHMSVSEKANLAFIDLLQKHTGPVKGANGKEEQRSVEQLASMDANPGSSKVVDGCLKILDQLNFSEAVMESDVGEEDASSSSDSDSESEPELKWVEPKTKRKKKRHKKKKDGATDKSKSDKTDKDRPNSISALPAIQDSESDSQRKKTKQRRHTLASVVTPRQPSARYAVKMQKRILASMMAPTPHTPIQCSPKPQSPSPTKMTAKCGKTYPAFVNKYEGRSNGGIPCFSEERLLERASKRMAEMKRKIDDPPMRESTFYMGFDLDPAQSYQYNDGTTRSDNQLIRMNTQMELRSQFLQALRGGTAVHLRTGYTHGEVTDGEGSLSDLPQREPPCCTDSDSGDELPQRVPISALSNPYHSVPPSLHMHPHVPSYAQRYNQHQANLQQHLSEMGKHNRPPVTQVGGRPNNSSATCVPYQQFSQPVLVSSSSSLNMDRPNWVGTPVTVGAPMRSTPRRQPSLKQGADGSILKRAPVSTEMKAPTLLSREYTDLLLHKLRNHKTTSFTTHPFLDSTASKQNVPRHSTCE